MLSRASSLFLASVLVLAGMAPSHLLAGDLAGAFKTAISFVSRQLTEPKLNSAYGTPLLDSTGRRVDSVFLNFTGRDSRGDWMLMSLELAPDDTFTYDPVNDGPRPDNYGHHLHPAVELPRWFPPEEAVVQAVTRHPGHAPAGPVSMAYHWTTEYGGRCIIVIYWVVQEQIHHVVFDARYGSVLEVGTVPAPPRHG